MEILEENFEKTFQKKVTVSPAKSIQHCHVVLFVCLIVSRVGTDLDAAAAFLQEAEVQKPAIIAALHQTLDPDKYVDSSKVIKREKTLVLDFLISDTEVIECRKNREGFEKIANYLKSEKLNTCYFLKRGWNAQSCASDEDLPLLEGGGTEADGTQECCCSRLSLLSRNTFVVIVALFLLLVVLLVVVVAVLL